jgi:chemotaxis protein histidine kinase CheA
LSSIHPTDPFGALQAISQELAFLSPQSVACAILGDGRVALILDPDTLGTLQKTVHRNAASGAVAFH